MIHLPNITSFSISPYSTYWTLRLSNGVSLNISERANGDRDVYTYIDEFRLEMPHYQIRTVPSLVANI